MITVLTPTFNRAHTLPRLYESLLSQTCQDFEWLVVDDGSQDGTRELVAEWLHKHAVPIQYVYQANAGKHVALNTGARHAQGDTILIVDSDDALRPEAIQHIHDKLARYDHAQLNGLCFRRTTFDGRMLGRIVDAETLYLTPTEAAKTFRGDLAYAFKKTALAANPFPQIPGERFVPELYIWNKIGDAGRIIYFPKDAIYLCDYLPDGYTNNFRSTLKKSPRGFQLFYVDQIKREASLLLKLKYTIRTIQCLYFRAIRKLTTPAASEPAAQNSHQD